MAKPATKGSIAGCLCCLVLLLVGFMAAELAIWVGGKYKTEPAGRACEKIPLDTTPGAITTFRFEKDLWSRWHWRYEGKGGIDGKFEQRCPSISHDAELSLNGRVAGRTDGKLLSIKSETHVLDCHGDRVFQWDSGSAIQTAINSFQINAQYLIRKNGTLIAYVDSTNLFSTDIILKDADPVWNGPGPEVARMTRKKFTLSAWSWEFKVSNASHPASDGLLLTMLAGQRAFSENRKDSDSCNKFFKGVGYFIVAMLVLGFLAVVVIVKKSAKGGWKKKKSHDTLEPVGLTDIEATPTGNADTVSRT